MNIGIRMSLNTVFNISFNGCRNTSISTTDLYISILTYWYIGA